MGGLAAGRCAAALLLLLASGLGAAARAQTVSVAPDERSRLVLVRTTLIALDHATRSGNYGVLRELGSPSFRAANSEARLATIFAGLREQRVDLQAVAVLEPRYTHEPFVDENNLLRLTGRFEMRPRPVAFDLAFQLAGGRWRVFGIAVDPVEPPGAGEGS